MFEHLTPGDDAVSEGYGTLGGGALLENVGQWGWVLRFYSLALLSVLSFLAVDAV